MIKFIRSLFIALIVLAAIFFSYCFFTKKGIFALVEINNAEVKIGKDFILINQDNQIIRSDDFKDKYMMIFFGFSSCKKVCPMNLGIISETLVKLDEKAHEKLQTFFITIDPERDNIEKLKEFHQQFDHRIQMLTGKKEKIDEVISGYKVYTSKISEEEINHSSIIYFIGPGGKYITHFIADLNSDASSQSDKIAAKIKEFINKI